MFRHAFVCFLALIMAAPVLDSFGIVSGVAIAGDSDIIVAHAGHAIRIAHAEHTKDHQSMSSKASDAGSCTNPSHCPSGVYELDMTHSSLLFRVNHMGLTSYTARFTKFDAKLTFNAADVEESNLTASVWLDSVKTDYPDSEKIDFDEELSVEKKWFNTRKFSQAHFVTNSLKRTSKTTGIMEGTLTFLGISKPLEFNVIFNKGYRKMPFSDEPALGVSATATLNRSDWGMTAFIPYVGDNVDLILELEFHQVSSSASG